MLLLGPWRLPIMERLTLNCNRKGTEGTQVWAKCAVACRFATCYNHSHEFTDPDAINNRFTRWSFQKCPSLWFLIFSTDSAENFPKSLVENLQFFPGPPRLVITCRNSSAVMKPVPLRSKTRKASTRSSCEETFYPPSCWDPNWKRNIMKPIVCSVANGFWICLDFICFPGTKLLLLGWPSYLSNSGDVWNTWHKHVRPPKVHSDFVIYVICILGISGNLCSISFTCHHFPIYIMFYLSACITQVLYFKPHVSSVSVSFIFRACLLYPSRVEGVLLQILKFDFHMGWRKKVPQVC